MNKNTILAALCFVTALIALPLLSQAADKEKGAGTFGAMAYSIKSQQYGVGAGESAAEAKKNAIKFCGKSDCEVVIEYKDDCAALAASKDGYYGVGEGKDKAEAKENAMKFCNEKGKGCELVATDCTSDK